jgi:hypothetical protein
VALRLIQLLILVEQNDWFHLDYALRNLNDTLHSRERKFEIETILLRFLKKLCNNHQLLSHRPTLSELHHQLQSLANTNPSEAQFIRAFDAISWVEGKLNKLSFS